MTVKEFLHNAALRAEYAMISDLSVDETDWAFIIEPIGVENEMDIDVVPAHSNEVKDKVVFRIKIECVCR